MQKQNKRCVYYSPEKIKELWEKTKQKRSSQSTSRPQETTNAVVEASGTKRRLLSPTPTAVFKKKQTNVSRSALYNHYQNEDVPELVEAQFALGGFETQWEGIGSSNYGTSS